MQRTGVHTLFVEPVHGWRLYTRSDPWFSQRVLVSCRKLQPWSGRILSLNVVLLIEWANRRILSLQAASQAWGAFYRTCSYRQRVSHDESMAYAWRRSREMRVFPRKGLIAWQSTKCGRDFSIEIRISQSANHARGQDCLSIVLMRGENPRFRPWPKSPPFRVIFCTPHAYTIAEEKQWSAKPMRVRMR